MYSLEFENGNGDVIVLTGREGLYQVLSIEGLNPPKATLYRSEVAGMDGTKFMSAKLEERNIVVTIRINGDVEANRLQLYDYFKTKHYTRMHFTNARKDVYAEGYVESMECDLFDISEQMQISIICPDPYFKAMEEIVSDISKVIGAFEFPFAFGAEGVESSTVTDEAIEFSTYDRDAVVIVNNEGESDTGMIIRINFTGAVDNPTIYNVDTKESFEVNTAFEDGDEVTINTNPGEKRILLLRDGVTSNLINKVARGSTWLTLDKGDNQFTYTADEGVLAMRVVFTHRTRYQGV